MKLPSKAISYNESVLSKLPLLLGIIKKSDIQLKTLYLLTRKSFNDIEEYIDTLDCLYALKVIQLKEESGVLHYVA